MQSEMAAFFLVITSQLTQILNKTNLDNIYY